MTFPGAGANVYRNEAGEPIGWDYPSYDEPDYDPDAYRAGDYDDGDDEADEDDDEDEALAERRYSCVKRVGSDEFDEAVATAESATDAASEGTREWVQAMVDHLSQWDMGEPNEEDVFATGPTRRELRSWAHDVDIEGGDGYVLVWDWAHAWAALYRPAIEEG